MRPSRAVQANAVYRRCAGSSRTRGQSGGAQTLLELDTVVSPDTLSRWHRQFVPLKWNFTHRRGPGRHESIRAISELVVCMAQDNPGGYTRIQGALANLKHGVDRRTIANAEAQTD